MLAGLLAVGLLQAATAAQERSAADEARDRAAIEALMWRYIRALDTADADAYAAAFTADGTFTSGQNAERGSAELKKINDFKARRAEQQAKGAAPTPALYHVVANHTITFVDRDHARYDAYWMTMAASAGPDTPARVAGVGRSVDMLVRQNGQWLIQSRDVAPK
jgi:3-phenylpropionate/cinnamic acid dioxygenase small subunit